MGRLVIDRHSDTRQPFLPLVPEQRDVAGCREGPAIVLGGPGTGKTHTMIARVDKLIEAGAAPDQITVITLSDHAGMELKQDLLNLREGDDRVDHVFVGTLYAYTAHFLRTLATGQPDRVPKFTIWGADQCRTLLSVIARSHHYQAARFSEYELSRFLDWQSFNRNRPDDPDIPPPDRSWYVLDRDFQKAKAELSVMDCNDLTEFSAHTLDASADIRDEWRSTRTRHLLIDDFQDTTRLQYALLRRMTGPTRSITVFADPNQRIGSGYAADPNICPAFVRDFRDVGRHHLRINHRATGRLVSIIENVNSSGAVPGFDPDQQRAVRPDRGKPILLIRNGPTRLYQTVANDLQFQHYVNKTPLADFAILYPNPSVRPTLTTQLANRRIPYTVLGEPGYGETMECRALRAILTLIVNPCDCAALVQATEVDTRRPNSLTRDRERQHFHSIIERSRRTGSDLVTAARNLLPNIGSRAVLYGRLSYVVDSCEQLSRAMNAYNATLGSIAENAWSNISQHREDHYDPYPSQPLHEILQRAQTFPKVSDESLMDHIRRFLHEWTVTAHSAESVPSFGHESADAPGVTLSTFRAAQGRQWNTVFVVDCTEEAMKRSIRGSDDPDEVYRLFYVAMSRARDRLYFCPPDSDGHNTAQAPFELITMLGELVDRR